MIKLFSLPGCGRCQILKEKLTSKQIVFEVIEDMDTMKQHDITTVPVLQINDNVYLQYAQANKYINGL
jgi:glutaredoxin